MNHIRPPSQNGTYFNKLLDNRFKPTTGAECEASPGSRLDYFQFMPPIGLDGHVRVVSLERKPFCKRDNKTILREVSIRRQIWLGGYSSQIGSTVTRVGGGLRRIGRSNKSKLYSNQRKVILSQEAANHHKKAAKRHEQAARRHNEAATHHEAGNRETAAQDAHLAPGHQIHAAEHAEHAVKEHVEAHGTK